MQYLERLVEGKAETEEQDPKYILFGQIIRYLTMTETEDQRHLSIDTLKAYKIGIGEELFRDEAGDMVRVPVVNYPLYRPASKANKKEEELNIVDSKLYECVRSKLRGMGREHKHHQRFKPSGGHPGIFGLNTLKADSKVRNR